MRDVDVAICGAGAAGLSLAVRLAERAPGLRAALFDARTGFDEDRTFCGFATRGHPFGGAIEHRYGRIALADAHGTIERPTGRTPYVRIPGDLFYAVALRKLRAELRLGVRVEGLAVHGEHVLVQTSEGPVRARLAVDARGGFERGPGTLLQVFEGAVVRTERPIFDPDRALLMDFRVAQERGAHFVYVLPHGRTEALVEDTWFTTRAIGAAQHHAEIAAWLDRAGAGGFEVLRRERGVLPMSAAAPPRSTSPRIVLAGLVAGAAKGSTGYAFGFVQRHAAALARAIAGARLDGPAAGLPRWPALRSPLDTFYDRTFLRFAHAQLEERSAAIGEALVALFRGAPVESVARFLSEDASALDYARVMAAMPTAPMLRAALGR